MAVVEKSFYDFITSLILFIQYFVTHPMIDCTNIMCIEWSTFKDEFFPFLN